MPSVEHFAILNIDADRIWNVLKRLSASAGWRSTKPVAASTKRHGRSTIVTAELVPIAGKPRTFIRRIARFDVRTATIRPNGSRPSAALWLADTTRSAVS